jgi:cytochrome c biogenesis protein CcmG, thiol:disulfide interchange protein DsbE
VRATVTATEPGDLPGAIEPPNRSRAAAFVAVPIAVVMVLLVVVLFTRRSAEDRASATPLQDRPAPLITGTTLDGKAFDLDSLRGRWVLVNFFASWCVPCQQEHPELESFDRRHTQIGDAQLISVVFGDDTAKVRDFFAHNGGDWPVVIGDVGRIALDYGVTAPPETFVVDPAGIVRARFAFPVTSVYLDQQLDALGTEVFGSAASTG